MNNKRIGSTFEKEMAEMLSEKGYWVTLLEPRGHIGSQPCDLIAIKCNKPMLIDCKTSKSHLFPISRIEENQWNASRRYFDCGNLDYYIAIKYNEDIYMIPIDTIDKKAKTIDLREQIRWRS